jgi:RNA polymerase sigma-70 factor (ECF subfamily)
MPDDPAADVLRRFVQGDREAFEALFRQFEAEVHAWSLRIVRDPSAADDVVVEAFWRAYRGRARFDPARSFGAWLRRIATNVARDHLKVSRRHAHAAVDEATVPARAQPARDPGVADALGRALRRLPPRLQVVAILALVEEQPYAEIADALDVPVGTVKSRVFRATRALRRELARLGIHDEQP